MDGTTLKRKLTENFKRVRQRIEDACQRANRRSSSVTLVVVTKYASLDIIRVLVDMGVQHLGENKVQDLTKRAAMVNEWLGRRPRDPSAGARPRPHWHMVGHLQRNKVKTLLPWVSLIHSVDSLRLAEEIDAQAAKLDRVVPILLQVKVTDEPNKTGVAVAAVTHLTEQLCSLKNIAVHGMMAIAPMSDDEKVVRLALERARELFDEIVAERFCGPEFKDLSLGMSNDFEHAIEFGSTYVRIGSALFDGIELSAEVAPIGS